jgi:methyl-accepting chemotaxis protein
MGALNMTPEEINGISEQIARFMLKEAEEGKSDFLTRLYQAEIRNSKDPALLERMIRVEEELRHQGRRFEEMLGTMRDNFAQVDKRFEQVDKRFEQVDKRFEQVDKRFEQVDKRFEELIANMNYRFEQVDKRFEQVDKRFEELIANMNYRFEQVDKRFEQVDKRFSRLYGFLFTVSLALMSGIFGLLAKMFFGV